jgi:enoyl-CoA hydratase/carnithine racemase
MAELITRREGRVGWMILSNLTKQNAISYDIWRSIPEAVGQFERDSAVRVIALRGEGQHFSGGADVAEFEHARDSIGAVSSYNRVVDDGNEALLNASKPTLARIQGVCHGGGLALALHCDLRFCSDDAEFSLQAARLGFGVSYSSMMRFSHLVGLTHSADILFSGRVFKADEALRMQIVNRVVPVAQLDAVFGEWCNTIAEGAPLTIAAMKRAFREVYRDPDKRDLRTLRGMIETCYSSDDYREGRLAFMQKRKPDFKGR